MTDALKFASTGDFKSAVPGINGMGFLLPATWTKLKETVAPGTEAYDHYIVRLAKVLSTNPAEALGLKKTRGAIMNGLSADLIIWKPHKLFESHLTSQLESSYSKSRLYGKISQVYLNGRLVVDKRGHIASGNGRFVTRETLSPLRSRSRASRGA
jgi:allantoinase